MNSERYGQVKKVFFAACALPPQQRAAYVAQTCGDDLELVREVQSLLEHDDASAADAWSDENPGPDLGEQQPSSAEDPSARWARSIVSPTALPERIGRYRILGVLGEGGMGVVYLAEQGHPKREVALKVMRSMLPTDQARRRFDFEAQVLAGLQHPGIVQVYDAGVTAPEQGAQPFFVLERVTGEPLTRYAAERRLDVRQRLALLAKVCDAVQHAHERGVIHRDLKPANILVDQAGRPKILDFGIARAISRQMQPGGSQTDAGQLLGTIPYMSPEQLSKTADAIDTRSDIYALGVIGYELLAARTPHDVRGKALAEAIRTISEQRPAPLGALDRTLRGDVETIIAKALERDRDRRYASAAELAGDIRRFLADQPIVARPPSAAYHLRKFARRNAVAVAAAGALLAVILVAAPLATWQAIRARAAERLARERLVQAERSASVERAVNAFLTDDLLAAADPSRLGRDVTVVEVLDRAADKIGDRFGAKPVVEAAVRYTLGNTYAALGEYEKAQPHLERALTLRRVALGESHPETASAMNSLAGVHWKLGRIDQGAQLWTRSIEIQQKTMGPDALAVLDSQSNLASAYRSQGRYAQAAELLEETIERRAHAQGEDHPQRLVDQSHLGSTLMHLGRMEQAERMLASTLAAQRRVLHDDHPDTMRTANALGLLYKRLRRVDEAEALLSDTLERQQRVLGDRHDDTLATMNNLAILYDDQRRYDESEPLLTAVFDALREHFGDDHPNTLNAANNLAASYREQGRYAEAEPLFLRTLQTQRRVLGEGHPSTLVSKGNLARVYTAWGKYEQAEPLALGCYEGMVAALGEDHPYAGVAAQIVAQLYEAWGKPEQAAAWRAKAPTED